MAKEMGMRQLVKWIAGHRVASISIIVVLAFAAAGARVFIRRSQGSLSPPLTRGAIVDAVYGIGTVTATHSFAIKPGVVGTIQDLYVKEGDFVEKGGKLAEIDRSIYRAPFAGVVNFLPFKVGENVFTQLPVMVLTDLANRYLVVSLEQQGALRIRVGQRAKLSFDSMRSQQFEGAVESVYSYNSNFLARIDVSALPPEILPDMTADVAIVVREVSGALLVPTSALQEDSVWVKRPFRMPEQVRVKIGVVDGIWAEALSGDLKEGDQLILRKKAGT
jgi:multidrug efflux pump subunit AcrA (membrane-fusion protein)